MFGLIVRLMAYVAIIVGFVMEFGNYGSQNISGSLIMGGVCLLVGLALRRAWKTRGRMFRRDDD